MYPPLFATLAAAAPVTALIGTSPVRAFPFGEAPAGVALPYVTFQTVTGQPENYLNRVPDIDSFREQIDVWASTVASARTVAAAVRDALETVAHLESYNGESRDPTTNYYRYSFDVEFLTPR